MTSRRPTPLKDEPVASFDELQDLLTENMAAINTLNKTLGNRTDTQAISPEEIASAAKNAVRELLEQRQRRFEQEDKEARHGAHSRRRNVTQNFRRTMPMCCKSVSSCATPTGISRKSPNGRKPAIAESKSSWMPLSPDKIFIRKE